MLKDCSTSCKTSACNNDLTETAQMFSEPNPQDNCFTCTYIERDNGEVEGNIFCADEPGKLNSSSYACPMYANAACYTGTNAHYVSLESAVPENIRFLRLFSAKSNAYKIMLLSRVVFLLGDGKIFKIFKNYFRCRARKRL